MEEKLKLRLIGLVVLIAVCLLAWPLLFSVDKQKLVHHGLALDETTPVVKPKPIPEIPEAVKREVEQKRKSAEQTERQTTERIAAVKEHYQEVAKKIEEGKSKTLEEQLTIEQDNGELIKPQESYIIQLGSFSSFDNAEKLKNLVAKAGFIAHTRPNNPQQPGPYIVVLGPFFGFENTENKKSEVLGKVSSLSEAYIKKFEG